MKAAEFDKKFDHGEDVTAGLDVVKIQRPGEEQERVDTSISTSPPG